jgi:eukaryotic-like serine/threonine-protein kinase
MQRSNVQGRQRYRFDAVLTTSRRDTVYAQAHDLSAGRDVLVTRLPIQPGATEAERRTLLVRAGLMTAVTGALPSATTPGLDDAFVDGDGLFLVSAAAPDVSLRTVVESGRMDIATAARLGADILAALDSAHEMRLIHGALDPDSIHVTEAGHVKIHGFGINGLRHDVALVSDPQIGSGFGAPELAADELPAEATDLFGLGAVLFYAIEGTGPQPSMIDAMDDAAWSALSLGPLAGPVRRLLAWDPGGRPTAAEIGPTLSALAGPRRHLESAVVARAQGDRTSEVLSALFGPVGAPAGALPTPDGAGFDAAAPAGPWDAPPSTLLGLFDEPDQAFPGAVEVPLWQPSPRAPEPQATPTPTPASAPAWSTPPDETRRRSDGPVDVTLESPWILPLDETRRRSDGPVSVAPGSPWSVASETRRPLHYRPDETDVSAPRIDRPDDATTVRPYVLAPPVQPAPRTSAADDTPRTSRRNLLRIGGGVVIAAGAAFAGIKLAGGSSTTASPRTTLKTVAPLPGPITAGPSAGTVRWTVAGPPNLYLHPFVLGDLLIASGDSVLAVHVADASLAWTLPGARRHLTTADGAIVAVDGPDGAHRLLTLNPKDGSTTGSVPLTTSVLGIAVANGIAYIIGGPHALDRTGTVLRAVDVASGTVLWSNTIDLYLTNSPILDETSVYVAGPSGILAYDLSTGHQTWRNPSTPGTQRAVRSAADGLISTRANDGIYTLDRSDGHVLWSVRGADVPYLSSDKSLANGVAYASGIGRKSASGRIRAIDEHTGSVKWTFDPKDGRSHAVVVNDVVYSTGTTALIALDSSDGTESWIHRFTGTATIGTVEPVLAGGLAIVPTADGKLNALETGSATN